MENPESHLAQGPKPAFTSRYADPNHPASSGDLLALVSGGQLSAQKLRSLRGSRSPLGRRSRGSYVQDPYASQGYDQGRDSRSNPPAPHASCGRPLGVRGIVGGIRDAQGSRSAGQRGSFESTEYDTARGENSRIVGRRAVHGDHRGKIGLLSPIAKLREQKVLYLAIVNMPSEAEMAQAREVIGQMDTRE